MAGITPVLLYTSIGRAARYSLLTKREFLQGAFGLVIG